MTQKIIFLVGPTAAGKTGLALDIAAGTGARIISCDSMQIYRGMGILTSTPSPAQLKRVRHYLIGGIDPAKDFNVSLYRSRAMRALGAILRGGRMPLFVGGSGLYMSVMVDGIFRARTEDPAVRLKLAREAAARGSGFLHERLAVVDPVSASRIHPNDVKRMIRALEVFTVSGKPISLLQPRREGLWGKYDVRIFALTLPREELYRRIDERVEAMFAQGLVDEVRRLGRRRLGKTASCAIGLREVNGYLEGACSLGEAKALMKRNTRQYAKRQMTWFRKDKRIVWVDGSSPAKALRAILKGMRD